MCRRIVSLFLAPCVLLTQSAVVLGHSHGTNSREEHDDRTHIHVHAIAFESGHSHHAHNHHHCDGVNESQQEHVGMEEPSPTVPLSDHDADAMYVSAYDVVLGARCQPVGELTISQWLYAPACILCILPATESSRPLADWTHAPPHDGVCPLYIRHLSLLF